MTNWLIHRFIKNHTQTDRSQVRLSYGKLAGIVGIVCNLLLSGCKLLIGTLSGSISISADGINNLSDASASIVTLLGFKLAEKPADEDHPFGHARMEYLSGLVVAALILVIGVELLQSSFEKILHPEDISFSLVMAGVLFLSVFGKLWLMLFHYKLGKTIQSTTLMATGTDCRNDILTSSAVLICALISHYTDLNLDGYVGLTVAGFICYSGITIAKDTINPLLGEPPSPETVGKIQKAILQYPKVLAVHDLIVHDYGPGRRFATVHAEMDSQEDPLLCHEIIDSIERDFLETHGLHMVIHYDPIVTQDPQLVHLRNGILHKLKSYDNRLSIHDFRLIKASDHTNVLFDMGVPYELLTKEDALKAVVLETLAAEEGAYRASITFDAMAFQEVGGSDHG